VVIRRARVKRAGDWCAKRWWPYWSNHTQFTAPNTAVTSASFETLSGQSNRPRILQFNLRVEF